MRNGCIGGSSSPMGGARRMGGRPGRRGRYEASGFRHRGSANRCEGTSGPLAHDRNATARGPVAPLLDSANSSKNSITPPGGVPMTTGPSTADQILDELEFLASAEHALVVEYLTVAYALFVDLPDAS